MYEFLSQHRAKLAALLLLVMPLIMLRGSEPAQIGKDQAPKPVELAHAGLAWSGEGAYRALGWLGGFWRGFKDSDLAQENDALREEIARLREEKARLIGVLQENARLRKQVGFQEKHPEFQMVPARVIGRDISPYFRVLRLKIESPEELKPRQPVVVAGGVVGQIHEVYGKYADVIIVADPRSRIDAVSQRNRAPGVVMGLGHQSDYLAEVSYLNQKDLVRPGDVLVTGGKDEIFPRELIIGTVSNVESARRGLFQTVELEPAVDFSRLDEVFIITGQR